MSPGQTGWALYTGACFSSGMAVASSSSASSLESEEGEEVEEGRGRIDGDDPEESARQSLFPELASSGEDSDWIDSDAGEWSGEGDRGGTGEGLEVMRGEGQDRA